MDTMFIIVPYNLLNLLNQLLIKYLTEFVEVVKKSAVVSLR